MPDTHSSVCVCVTARVRPGQSQNLGAPSGCHMGGKGHHSVSSRLYQQEAALGWRELGLSPVFVNGLVLFQWLVVMLCTVLTPNTSPYSKALIFPKL